MPKLVVVTNYLPKYSIEFYNRLIELYPAIKLTVVADISSNVALNQYGRFQSKFNVVDNPIIEKNGLLFRKDLHKKINAENADYIVFYGNPREVTITFLNIFYRIVGRPFSVYGMFHRIGGQSLISKMYYKLQGVLSHKLLTYSRKGAEVLLGLGVEASKIKVVGTAINEKVNFRLQNEITENMILDFKKENVLLNKKVVLQVVRLSKIKKPFLLLEAAKTVLKHRNDVVFVLIGGGELFDDIKKEVETFGLNNNILLLGSIYEERDLAYWFTASSVFVMPTCIGLSAHHAFSYGLPIITDNDLVNQASEFDILYDGLNCKLYEKANVQSFADAIIEVVDNDTLQKFLAKNALETVRNTHSLDRKCTNFVNALNLEGQT